MRTMNGLILGLLAAATVGGAQPANPVTNGGFETLAANGLPSDWSYLGDVTVSGDAHSGNNAVLIRREKSELEAGLNRDWKPDSGEQGTMLSQLKGGIRFWYKALDCTDDAALHFYVIPMGKRPMEDTGERRADCLVPKGHHGDGKWHAGVVAYNFTGNPDVKWVHLSPRISGAKAALLLDDIEWVEKVGPVLSIARLRWEEDAARPGERGTLAVRVHNGGDAPTGEAAVRLTCPPYLRVTGTPEAAVAGLEADQYTEVRFAVEGRRDRPDLLHVVGLVAGTEEPQCEADFRLEAKPELVQLRARRFILSPGEETTVEAVVRNRGTAISGNVRGKLLDAEGVSAAQQTVAPMEVPPGGEGTLAWRVQADRQSWRLPLAAEVRADARPLGTVRTDLVIGAKPRPAPDVPGAHVGRDVAWLQGDALRLVVHRSDFGFGIADLQVKKRGWETVGRFPSMGRVAWEDGGIRHEAPTFGEAHVAGEALLMEASGGAGDGPAWRVAVRFSLRDDGRNLGLTSTLKCDRAMRLLAFDAPMLYVGEGTFGGAKDEALFPGLDWLDRDDVSSEDDGKLISREHPHHLRHVPHPNMITIPLMSVHREGTTVALLWDCRRPWDGEHDRPAAVFACPDRFQGRNATLMGLFAPSVGTEGGPWVQPNEREATVPFDLPANREINLEAVLYARAGTQDALSAMDEWFRLYGVPEPKPYPFGSLAKQTAFNMRAYLESMWDEEEKAWWNTRGAGKPLSVKGRYQSFVHELLKGAMLVDDPALAERCRARAQEILDLEQAHPLWNDQGFDYGHADSQLLGWATTVGYRIAAQGTDGAWRFDADRMDPGIFRGLDYHDLGRDEAAELGTSAQNAYELLRFARMTGDQRAYEAGVKALRSLGGFRVPRAAQVWEVMVHAPDILAAADAVEAYLEAYRYDGDREWLREAVRWGRGGLPFVYMWDDPKLPFVLGASIPVFGASWETGSWFGRPVQWNGLRHARALVKLAAHDDSLPWRQLAELLVVSAMYQQSTDDVDVALWPDSISALDGSKAGWIFAPLHITEPLYMLIGRQEEPDTAILGRLPQRIHLSSSADIQGASWDGDVISASLSYPPEESGYTLLVGVSKPSAVLLDGKAIAEMGAALEAGAEAGWRHDTGHAMLFVRATTDGKHRLEVQGVRYLEPLLLPDERTRIVFEFADGPEGWVPANHIEALTTDDGVLHVPVTGVDPFMTRQVLRVDGSTVAEVAIRMRAPTGTEAQFYWGTQATPGFAEERVIDFPITGDGQWHEYRLPVGTHASWKGQTITAIRLDPLSPGSAATVDIDWIRGQ